MRESRGVHAQRRCDHADQMRRRYRTRVGDRQRLPGERGHVERRGDGGDRVADVEQAAPIVHAGEWQAALCRDRLDQQREVALHARAVHQRQAQDHTFHVAVAASLPYHVLGFGLAPRVGVARLRRVSGAKRTARSRRLAVDLDRAREHDTAHLRAARGVEQAARHMDVGDDVRRRIVIAAGDVRAPGEVHDAVDAVERLLPSRRRRNRRARDAPGRRRRRRHAPRRRTRCRAAPDPRTARGR